MSSPDSPGAAPSFGTKRLTSRAGRPFGAVIGAAEGSAKARLPPGVRIAGPIGPSGDGVVGVRPRAPEVPAPPLSLDEHETSAVQFNARTVLYVPARPRGRQGLVEPVIRGCPPVGEVGEDGAELAVGVAVGPVVAGEFHGVTVHRSEVRSALRAARKSAGHLEGAAVVSGRQGGEVRVVM